MFVWKFLLVAKGDRIILAIPFSFIRRSLDFPPCGRSLEFTSPILKKFYIHWHVMYIMQSLISLLDVLNKKAKKYEQILNESEATTRIVLIDPLLRELGWDLTNPDEVRIESPDASGKQADYKMGNHIMIEAKRMGIEPKKNHVKKYFGGNACEWYIVTNGLQYNAYDPYTHSPVMQFNIRDSIREIPTILSLQKDIVMADDAYNKRYEKPQQPEREEPHKPSTEIPLSGMTSTVDIPKLMIFPDGKTYDVGKWNRLPFNVVKWLISKKIFKLADSIKGVVNEMPCSRTGAKYLGKPERIGGYYVKTHGSQITLRQDAIRLLKHHDIAPDTVLLQY